MGSVSWVQVLHEDAQLLVVHKPAGLVCHPTKGDAASSLIGRVRLHLGAESGVIHACHLRSINRFPNGGVVSNLKPLRSLRLSLRCLLHRCHLVATT